MTSLLDTTDSLSADLSQVFEIDDLLETGSIGKALKKSATARESMRQSKNQLKPVVPATSHTNGKKSYQQYLKKNGNNSKKQQDAPSIHSEVDVDELWESSQESSDLVMDLSPQTAKKTRQQPPGKFHGHYGNDLNSSEHTNMRDATSTTMDISDSSYTVPAQEPATLTSVSQSKSKVIDVEPLLPTPSTSSTSKPGMSPSSEKRESALARKLQQDIASNSNKKPRAGLRGKSARDMKASANGHGKNGHYRASPSVDRPPIHVQRCKSEASGTSSYDIGPPDYSNYAAIHNGDMNMSPTSSKILKNGEVLDADEVGRPHGHNARNTRASFISPAQLQAQLKSNLDDDTASSYSENMEASEPSSGLVRKGTNSETNSQARYSRTDRLSSVKEQETNEFKTPANGHKEEEIPIPKRQGSDEKPRAPQRLPSIDSLARSRASVPLTFDLMADEELSHEDLLASRSAPTQNQNRLGESQSTLMSELTTPASVATRDVQQLSAEQQEAAYQLWEEKQLAALAAVTGTVAPGSAKSDGSDGKEKAASSSGSVGSAVGAHSATEQAIQMGKIRAANTNSEGSAGGGSNSTPGAQHYRGTASAAARSKLSQDSSASMSSRPQFPTEKFGGQPPARPSLQNGRQSEQEQHKEATIQVVDGDAAMPAPGGDSFSTNHEPNLIEAMLVQSNRDLIPQAEIVMSGDVEKQTNNVTVKKEWWQEDTCRWGLIALVILAIVGGIVGGVCGSGGCSSDDPVVPINITLAPTSAAPTLSPTQAPTAAPTENVVLVGMERLELLTNLADLWNGTIVGMDPTIPSEIGLFTSLTSIELYEQGLTGSIPTEVGLLSNLERLRLENNELTGSLPSELGMLLSPDNKTFFTQLYTGNNQLTGSIPTELSLLTELDTMQLFTNQLTGAIDCSLSRLSNLRDLSLDNNLLTGTLCKEFGGMSNLQMMYLYGNYLNGSIPLEFGMLTNLQVMHLAQNQLTGWIPHQLGYLSLQELLLYENSLVGTIPSEFGLLSNVLRLQLDQNSLVGSLPSELGMLPLVNEVTLNINSLTGSIPSELGLAYSITKLRLDSNAISGSIPSDLGMLALAEEIGLAFNTLTGTIPTEFGQLSAAQWIFLNDNFNLTGSLPSELGLLTDLRWLQFDRTDISGELPMSICVLTQEHDLSDLYFDKDKITCPTGCDVCAV